MAAPWHVLPCKPDLWGPSAHPQPQSGKSICPVKKIMFGSCSKEGMPQRTQLVKICTLNFLSYEDHRKDHFQITTSEHSNILNAIYLSN